MDETPVRRNDAAHRFEAGDGDALAVCVYRQGDGVLGIIHTEVPEALEGRGIAAALVKTALSWARSKGWRVEPTCSYAAEYMRRHPETQDLLAGPS